MPIWMSPRRRFLSSLFGGRVDRPAVGSPVSVATVDQMEATNAFFPEVHLNGESMARLASAAYTQLEYDVIMPVFSVVQEAAALGCDICWGDVDKMPTPRGHPWASPDDVMIPEGFLEHPAIVAVLEAIAHVRRTYPNVAIVGKVMGPWTMAYHMRGLEPFLIDTLKAPSRVCSLLDKLMAIPLLFGRAQIAAGVDALCIADHATGDLVRASMYHEMLEPRHKQLVHSLGCPVVLHICGNTLDRMSFAADAGFDAFHFESKVEASAAVAKVGGRMSLWGNVNIPTTLYTGTPEDVEQAAHSAMVAGVRLVGPECAVPLRTPMANLKAISKACGACTVDA